MICFYLMIPLKFVHLKGLIMIIITPWKFFTSANADGLSQEFEWQEISSSLLDSSKYSGRYKKCRSLDGLHSSSSHFNNPVVTLPRASITIDINVTLMLYFFLNSLARNLSFFSLSFNFIRWSPKTGKSTILQVLFLCLVVEPKLSDPFVY